MGDNDSELFLQKVVSFPNEIDWKNPHDIQLEKLSDDSIGVVLKTCQILKSCKTKKGLPVTLRVYEAYGVPSSLDVHVESQRLLNPLLNNSNSSSICSSVSVLSEDIKLESLTRDHRRKKTNSQLQLRVSKTSGSHSWYTSQSSNLSLGSDLTPVETPETPISGGCSEATPLMAFSHVGGPSSLGSDAESVDVGKAALQNPCNIKWQINTEKITLQKTARDDKVGFYYKIKKTSGDSELYFLVEKVDVGSPSHGKLHLGDWIRSVNGTPITDNKDLLKQEIKKSAREVTLVIQRPESVLRPAATATQNHSKKRNSHQPTEHSTTTTTTPQKPQVFTPQTTTSTAKGWAEPGTVESRFFSDVTAMALDDIKIDGMSVYQGSVPMEPNSEPAIVISEPNGTTIESFITGREITPSSFPTGGHANLRNPATLAALNSHRRNNSESSVAVLSKSLAVNPSGASVDRPTTSTSDEEMNVSNGQMVSDCIKHIATRDLQRRPYIRINQISTSSHPHTNISKKILKGLGIEENTLMDTRHVCQVSQKGVEATGSKHRLSKKVKVEDFIIAKFMTESFKCRNASVQDVRKAVLSSDNKLLMGSNTLIESFMQNPPPLDLDFVEVEVENFVYEDILNFWPSVYFTSNAVYVLVFDYNLFVMRPLDEIKKLQMCINLIHSSSSSTKIYLLCDNYPSASPLDSIMNHLSPLENYSKVTNMENIRCSNCGCDRKKIPPDALSQIQENENTDQIYFLANRSTDWQAFTDSIQDFLCSASKFPMSGVLAMKMLSAEESDSMITTTMTYFKQSIIQQILPGLNEREALTSLHQSGKICWHSQVAHRTVHSNAHNMFILLRPVAIRESVQCVQGLVGHKSTLGHRLTHQQVFTDCLASLKYKYKEELVMFLELYHILEAVKASEPQSEYYIVPQLLEPPSNLTTLVKRQISGQKHQIAFVDFHGLLPVNMCLSLLARLGEVLGATNQIKSVCTGCFEYQGMSLLVHLIPYYAKAVILITFDQASAMLSTEGVFQLITSALQKAVPSNLLMYHVGPACLDHMTQQELVSLIACAEFFLLAQKVHILDAGEQTTVLKQAQWNSGTMGANGVHIDVHTLLRDIPSHVEDVLCKGLNFGSGWKYLFESVGLADWKLEDEFGRSENPTKSLLTYLKTLSTCTLKDVVKVLKKKQRKDVLHDLVELGVSCSV